MGAVARPQPGGGRRLGGVPIRVAIIMWHIGFVVARKLQALILAGIERDILITLNDEDLLVLLAKLQIASVDIAVCVTIMLL